MRPLLLSVDNTESRGYTVCLIYRVASIKFREEFRRTGIFRYDGTLILRAADLGGVIIIGAGGIVLRGGQLQSPTESL